MKKIFYIMRHGQTLFNVRRKIQGSCDSPLTEIGIEQARLAGEYLRDIGFDHAYSSTAERASDTLEIATGGKLSYTRLKGLKEVNYLSQTTRPLWKRLVTLQLYGRWLQRVSPAFY